MLTGTFTSVGLETAVEDGRLVIRTEGRVRKFVESVGQITFSGTRAVQQGRPVLYVTERCVFALTSEGLELTEVAPGIDIERDILGLMDCAPIVNEPASMDQRIFVDAQMGLQVDLLYLDINDRIAMDAEGQHLFVNFEKLRVRRESDIASIRRRIEAVCGAQPARVDVIVNYDDTRIDPDVKVAFAEMVRAMEDKFYKDVTRHASSAFMRMKLGHVLRRGAAPHIFETADEARNFLNTANTSTA